MFKKEYIPPCYYIHTTNKKRNPIPLIINSKLTKKQKTFNDKMFIELKGRLKVFHAKKMFLRFLKENGIYEIYCQLLTSRIGCDIDSIIERNFFSPFMYHFFCLNSIFINTRNLDERKKAVSTYNLFKKIDKQWKEFIEPYFKITD